MDYVFLTHTHYDHADPWTIKGILKVNDKAKFIVLAPEKDVFLSYGIPEDRLILAREGQTIDCGEIKANAVAAAHEEFHINDNGDYFELGYKVAFGDIEIYHARDTLVYDGLVEKIKNADIAYLGYLKEYTVYSDAANDADVLALLDENYDIINDCMCKEYGYDKNDQKEFALLSRKKFTDRTIEDTVARNGREPQRKITRFERVVGPLFLELKYGYSGETLIKTLAAMLLYTLNAETERNDILKVKGYDGVLSELCDIQNGSELYNRIMKYVIILFNIR